MCGICGNFNFDSAPADTRLLAGMIGAVRHRGPDDCGIATDGFVGLGHARLSIIDVQGGHQPMHSSDGNLTITFNGEIFNYLELRAQLESRGHSFRTRSDTEVILHLYEEEGEQCVHKFNGQWAFAIWDRKRQRLFLSRDRLGVRPLFYTHTPRGFLFASEIKALMQHPSVSREIDLQALDQVFTFWSPLPPRTLFKNIFQLPPGSSLTVDQHGLRVNQYWSISYPAADEAFSCDEENLASQLLDLLVDATRVRLRSDVPVGAYLSGGVDSTAIAALAKEIAGGRLRTFSLTFDELEFNEADFQIEAVRFLETNHSSLACSKPDIASLLPSVVWHCEQPILRTAPAPMLQLSRFVKSNNYKVVLTGEGADELFGGYDIFKEAKIRRFWARDTTSQLRSSLLKRLYPYVEGLQRQPLAYLQRFFRISDADLASPFFSHLPRWELTARLKLLLSPGVHKELEGYDATDDLLQILPTEFRSWSAFSRAEYLETTGLLPGYILSSQGDRMAMANSVETRFPFLDHRVVDFATKLSPNLKMKGLSEKYLLKRAVSKLVPSQVLKRFKQPYRAPGASCFLGNSSPEYVEALLSPSALRNSGIFDPNAVAALIKKLRSRQLVSTKDNMALTGVLTTQLLYQQFTERFWSTTS
jgi:asparagine synthase (glutamine-hydrolysing)